MVVGRYRFTSTLHTSIIDSRLEIFGCIAATNADAVPFHICICIRIQQIFPIASASASASVSMLEFNVGKKNSQIFRNIFSLVSQESPKMF